MASKSYANNVHKHSVTISLTNDAKMVPVENVPCGLIDWHGQGEKYNTIQYNTI